MPKQKQIHKPVMLQEVLNYLQPVIGQDYLDVTAGYGGHAQAILARTKNPSGSILVDRDMQATRALKSEFDGKPVKILHKDFLEASRELADSGYKFDMILADLGVSSLHLNEASRGFAFSKSGPLDMRMDNRQELSADQIVNDWDEQEIAHLLKNFGEEPKAVMIAKNIVAARPIKTTDQLAQIVSKSYKTHSRMHPATRTFQAIRIAVNSELVQLEQSLPIWESMLNPGGRLVIISFHSLEDRIVKQFLAEHAADTYDAQLILLTKKPISASKDEIVSNPRARSAKLRACAAK